MFVKFSFAFFQKSKFSMILSGINLFKVSNRNTRAMCEICLELIIKTPEHVIIVVLVFLLLTLNWFHTLFSFFYCWLWTSNYRWDITLNFRKERFQGGILTFIESFTYMISYYTQLWRNGYFNIFVKLIVFSWKMYVSKKYKIKPFLTVVKQ